jgi:hypothetical protein
MCEERGEIMMVLWTGKCLKDNRTDENANVVCAIIVD